MTAATVERTGIEILDDRVEHGERRVHYRWTVGESSGVETAMERTEPMGREFLEDRWRGLVGDGDYTDLGARLNSLLFDLADGLTRRNVAGPDTARIEDGKSIGIDTVMEIDELMETIREWLIERAAKVAAR